MKEENKSCKNKTCWRTKQLEFAFEKVELIWFTKRWINRSGDDSQINIGGNAEQRHEGHATASKCKGKQLGEHTDTKHMIMNEMS